MDSSSPPPLSLSDFPSDVQLNILSFLSPADVSSLACTSRRFSSLPSDRDLWLSMLLRRWGPLTHIPSWAHPSVPLPRLYSALHRWDPLLGFWRRIGAAFPLLVFHWGPSFLTASKLVPSPSAGARHSVVKIPFLWLGLSRSGEPVAFLRPGPGCQPSSSSSAPPPEELEFLDWAAGDSSDLVPVTVNFLGRNHLVLDECVGWSGSEIEGEEEAVGGLEGSSPPEVRMSEIYRYFANRTSPGGGEKAGRRMRRKKGRERVGRRGRQREAEHFVKIVHCFPTAERLLQGLWKGICKDMKLEFYLVTYDDVGGINCRRVGCEEEEPFSGYSPIFWTSNTTFLEPPFSNEELDIYNSREHIRPVAFDQSNIEKPCVSRILSVNSSYDLVLPDLSGSSGDTRNVEGRIWVYENGTFGFGFLRNNFIVDLKPIAINGSVVDTVEYCCSDSSS